MTRKTKKKKEFNWEKFIERQKYPKLLENGPPESWKIDRFVYDLEFGGFMDGKKYAEKIKAKYNK